MQIQAWVSKINNRTYRVHTVSGGFDEFNSKDDAMVCFEELAVEDACVIAYVTSKTVTPASMYTDTIAVAFSE